MNKKLIAFLFSLMFCSALRAGFTPGRYEIRDLGGNAIGQLTVTAVSSTYDDKPATRIEWNVVYTKQPYVSQEKHVAFVGKQGLLYFKKDVSDEKGSALTEGRMGNGLLRVVINDHGRKFSTGASTSSYQVSEYEMDLPGSPFSNMELNAAKSVGVFSIRELAAVSARRNVNSTEPASHIDKMVPAFVVSTSFSKSVVTSWFTTNTHVLLKERWPDRQFVRIGN